MKTLHNLIAGLASPFPKLANRIAIPLLAAAAALALVQPCAALSLEFEETGSLAIPRSSQTATLLPSGKVLVVGGDDGGSCELYDPASGTWATTGTLIVPRAAHTATLLLTGKVLVAGGASVSTTELYDPATGTWSATGSLAQARWFHTATLLADGKVLVAAGFDSGFDNVLRSAELYDPATGTWTGTVGRMTRGRANHRATLLADGRVLVAGGNNVSGTQEFKSAELYDPATGTWSMTGDLTTARSRPSMTLLRNHLVLVAGGQNFSSGEGNLASTELYDPVSGTWSRTGDLPLGIWGHTATLLPNGMVLVTGGISSTIVANAEIYNPRRGVWSPTNPLTVIRLLHTATLLGNGEVLIAAGESSGGAEVASAELGVRVE
jgi:Galactose oxidase, central domain